MYLIVLYQTFVMLIKLCVNTLAGTATVQWWAGQGCTTPPASWTMRCWVNASVRDGSSLPSTSLHSSTISMGQYPPTTVVLSLNTIFVFPCGTPYELMNFILIIFSKYDLFPSLGWLCRWSQEPKAAVGKCPSFTLLSTMLLMLICAGTSS